MVWHLHIGSKLRFLDPPEVLSKIWANLVKKFKPPERPLLEVRRFFQWCQGMSLGILKRFREKKVQFFFRDFNFDGNIQRLLLLCLMHNGRNSHTWGPTPALRHNQVLKKESNKPSMNIRPSVHPHIRTRCKNLGRLRKNDFSLLLPQKWVKKALKWALKVLDWYSLVRYG